MKHLLIILAMLTLCFSAAAQDATLEPVATVESAPVTVITAEDGGTVNVTPDVSSQEDVQVSPIQTIVTHILSFIVGGGVMLAAVAGWIRAAMNDPVKMTLAEKLGDSVPLETVNQLTGFLDAAKAFVVEATDRQAMISKALTVNTANLPSSSTLTPPVGYEARPHTPLDLNTPDG